MKKRKSKSSRDNYLPPELIMEVLARLPAKTLMKFRCVCKTWCSLIDSSDFISLHSKVHNNNNSMNNAQLLAWEDCKRIGYILTLRRSDTFKTIRNLGRIPKFHSFHGYCNGLMLISSLHTPSSSLILWNPSIGKSLLLPDPPMNDVLGYRLGFAPSSNDYKVLAIADLDAVAAIYSLNGNCWWRTSDPLSFNDFGSSFSSTTVVSCGGAIYWMDYKAENLYSFDFDAEDFSIVPLPDSLKQSMVRFIFSIGDSMAIFTMSSENSLIWVLIKDGGENRWRLWYSGEPNSCICELLEHRILDILYIQKSNTFIISYISLEHQKAPYKLRIHQKLMCYNITSQEIKHLGKSIRGLMSFSTCVESLVFHKGFEGRRLISFS